MPSLDDVWLDTAGWTAQPAGPNERRWWRAPGDGLSAHFFDLVPDVPAPLEDLDANRAAYRAMLTNVGAAMLGVDVVEIAGVRALQVLFKTRQKPSGMTYVGSYTLPFAAFSFVLKVQSLEVGTTGVRDAMVFAQSGIRVVDGVASGWAQDPYDASYQTGLQRNQADDERWDAHFPDHPLSRCRAMMRTLAATTRLDASVLRAPRLGE